MIKKMIKGEKGFTLVELLAVIVILGIIVAIAIPAIGNIIDKAESDADQAEITLILDAARLYEVSNDLPVTVKELIDKDFLEERKDELTDYYTTKVIRDADGNLALDPAP